MCIEYDATTLGAMPNEKYPGLDHIRDFWDICPWTRVSFGAQWVIEPQGQYMLSTGAKRHFRQGEAEVFEAALEEALKRFVAVRKQERGSPQEAKVVDKLKKQVAWEWENKHPYFVDPYYFTKEIFLAKVGLDTRFPGILKYPDPVVRRQVADLLGEYALEEEDPGFAPGGDYFSFFGTGVAAYLDDESAEVRRAAAVALYRFRGEEAPEIEDDAELIAASRTAWNEAVAAQGGSSSEDQEG